MVDRDRVLAEPTRRLDQQHHVARLDRGEHDLLLVVDEQLAGRLAPGRRHLVPQLGGQVGGPVEVVTHADAHVRVGQLRVRQPLLVLATGVDQRVDQGVARHGVVGVVEPGDLAGCTDVVPGGAHAAQQPNGADRGVETHGVADPGVLGRVGAEHQGDSSLTHRDLAQPRVVDGDARDPRAALVVGDVAREAVLVDLLEAERHGDDATVELGDRDLVRGVQRGGAVVGGLPLGAAAGQAQTLEDRDVEGGDPLHVPGLVVTTRGGLAGRGAAGGQHGDDQRVEGSQLVVQLVGRGAQRGAEDRHAHGLTGGVDRVAQRVGERVVPAGLVRAVEQHAHASQVRVHVGGRAARSRDDPPGRHRHRRLEALAGQQHGVGEERVQLSQVLRAALGEVAVRLRCDPDRHRGHLHQLRVGLLLTSQHHHRHPGLADPGEPAAQVVGRPQDPPDHEVDVLEHTGHVLVAGTRRVGPDVVGPGGPSRQQVGVRGGKQRDAHKAPCQTLVGSRASRRAAGARTRSAIGAKTSAIVVQRISCAPTL